VAQELPFNHSYLGLVDPERDSCHDALIQKRFKSFKVIQQML
jgi:hypothetical protein